MLSGTLIDVATACSGRILSGEGQFRGVSTDTRNLEPGSLFVALKGPRFDAHDYLDAAGECGAAAAVVNRPVASRLPLVQVADTLDALAELGALARRGFQGEVVGVTGSNGKTTVKEMLAAILNEQGPCLATHGNLNNHIGVPLTLCRLDAQHQYAVIEMGAGGPREIAPLAQLARPKVAIITCCAPAHLEGFGSVEEVANTKAEIYDALPDDGTAVLPAFDAFADYWRKRIGTRACIRFGKDNSADVFATDVQTDLGGSYFKLWLPSGSAQVQLGLLGSHNILNALAAAAAAHCLGLSAELIAQGLRVMRPVPGRMQLLRSPQGFNIVHDAYNANPGSLTAAVQALGGGSHPCWVVLGDMAELGAEAEALHRQAGRDLKAAGVERLFGIGPLSQFTCETFGLGAAWFNSLDELSATLRDLATTDVVILIKGSRSQHLERLVSDLMQVS